MQAILETTSSLFLQLQQALHQLNDPAFQMPSERLGGSTIGQHVRHSLEMFHELLKGYPTGNVNYEQRQRYEPWQTQVQEACLAMNDILQRINLPDRPMVLQLNYQGTGISSLHTSYWRELAYNVEHLIHHMALIRVGLQAWPQVQVHPHFGIAPSTIQYQQSCAP